MKDVSCVAQLSFANHVTNVQTVAPMEFTVIAKEVKLMAIHKGIRIHQYLEDWLVRARSHQACLQHTQELEEICQKLGWLVNIEKS